MTGPLLVTADRLFDGTTTVPRAALRIDGDRVASVERGLLPPATCSGEQRDFPGCTVLPGLIDTHVHLVFSAAETNEEIIAQVAREDDEALLRRGAGPPRG